MNEGAVKATTSSYDAAAPALDLSEVDARNTIAADARAAFGPFVVLLKSVGVAVQKLSLNTTATAYDFS